MSHHRLSTRVTVLALAFVAVVMSHDVVMAANPHGFGHPVIAQDTGHPHEASHTDDRATHREHRPAEGQCTSLAAARPVTTSAEGPGTAALGVLPASLVIEVDASRADPALPGVPPGQTRALLQVWLI